MIWSMKYLSLFTFVGLLLPLQTVALADDLCPDFDSSKCMSHIKSLINEVNVAAARDATESQCYASPADPGEENFVEKALLLNASGCFYLFSLESLLGTRGAILRSSNQGRANLALRL